MVAEGKGGCGAWLTPRAHPSHLPLCFFNTITSLHSEVPCRGQHHTQHGQVLHAALQASPMHIAPRAGIPSPHPLTSIQDVVQ